MVEVGLAGCRERGRYRSIPASQPASGAAVVVVTQTMSGFDDDFGEMVGGKEETEELTEDPAAEFLAREQEQLGELETELGPLSGWYITPHPPPSPELSSKC